MQYTLTKYLTADYLRENDFLKAYLELVDEIIFCCSMESLDVLSNMSFESMDDNYFIAYQNFFLNGLSTYDINKLDKLVLSEWFSLLHVRGELSDIDKLLKFGGSLKNKEKNVFELYHNADVPNQTIETTKDGLIYLITENNIDLDSDYFINQQIPAGYRIGLMRTPLPSLVRSGDAIYLGTKEANLNVHIDSSDVVYLNKYFEGDITFYRRRQFDQYYTFGQVFRSQYTVNQLSQYHQKGYYFFGFELEHTTPLPVSYMTNKIIYSGITSVYGGFYIKNGLITNDTPIPPQPQYTEIDLFQESGAYVNGYVTKSYMPGLSGSNYVYDKNGYTDPSGWSSDNYYYWDFSKRYEFGHYSGDTWVPYAQSLADMPAESTYEPSESVMIRCPSGTNLVYWGRSYAGSGSSTLTTFKCRIYDDAFSVWQNSEHTDQYPWSSGLVTDIPYDSTKIYKILCMLNASGIPVNFTYLYLIEFSNSNGFLKIDISGSGTSERFAKFVFYTKEMPTVSKAGNFGDYNWLSTNSGIAENISSGGTSSNLGYIEDLTQILPDYDSTKSYGIIQWQEVGGTIAGRTEFGIINSSGKFKVENKTGSALNFYQAQIAVCSSSDATIVTVYDSNGNAFNAFKFVDGVGYYYVLDGIQTDWTDDLSSIGYSLNPTPPASYIEVTVFLVPSSTVTFSANDYWSGVVPYNSSTYQDLLDFGVNINYDGDYRISSNNPDFTFEPLGLFNGSTDLQADMSNFYCAPGPSTSSQYKNYMCIWSREAYNTPADKWKCRITKLT